MKLITLNIWGGKLYSPLIKFIKQTSNEVDVFCFQEIYSSSSNTLIARKMRPNIYEEIEKNLPEHQGYFAAHLINRDLDGTVSFPLKSGLAIFINKDIKVKECNDFFIHRSGLTLLNDNIATVPRNLQYIFFTINNKKYLISHFHGIWYPKSKIDTADRIDQSKKINNFLSQRKELKILCGDFNLLPNTKSLELLENNLINLITKYKIPTTRNNHYKRIEKHADYVLVSPKIKVKQFSTIDIEVSDHLPVLLEFS